MKQTEWFTTRQLLIALAISLALMRTIWTFALWYTGVRFAYRNDHASALAALPLAPEAGVSLQRSGTVTTCGYGGVRQM